LINNAKRYTFQKSRCGEMVPSYILADGNAQPLHSMIDPKKEAERLVSIIGSADFVIFLGLGGGFAPEAALEKTNANIIAVDFNKDGITELLTGRDYSKLLNNDRFSLLVDYSCEELKSYITANFNPVFCSGIKTIPLRTRIEQDVSKFEKTAIAIQEAIETISGDYSVQAHFGKRWFSNIIRNIITAEKSGNNFLADKKTFSANKIAIAAAGPSLDKQIPALAEFKTQGGFIISSDTALGALLFNNIQPDAVVSIDCQHISYYHFMGSNIRSSMQKIPLILDIASPPLLGSMTDSPVFFSGGHPLTRYLYAHWRRFPQLDTSGGNVTYVCLSLAQFLNAQEITIFGADFSYINCSAYARGTYIYPYFHNRQNRFKTLEAQASAFLYRSPFLPPENEQKDKQKKNYYETHSLRFYRKRLEEKASKMTAKISCALGHGAPINLIKNEQEQLPAYAETNEQIDKLSAVDFLNQYKKDIIALPEINTMSAKLNEKEKQILTTLLPYAAAVKKRNPKLGLESLISEVKRRAIGEIESVLRQFKL